MTYDLRLTVPTEEEIKGLSIDEILALFSFGKADMSTTPEPIIVGERGNNLKPVFLWKQAGGTLARPINTLATISAAAKYAVPAGLVSVWEGTFSSSTYTFGSSGRFFVLATVNAYVTSATNYGDIVLGKNDAEIISLGVVLRDVDNWGVGGAMIDIIDAVSGDTMSWYAVNTSAGAANLSGYKLAVCIIKWE